MDFERCDLCGAHTTDFILSTPRLEGPLVRCRECSLYFVSVNGAKTEASDLMDRLSERALELDLVDPDVEQRERPWRELAARERVEDLLHFVKSGQLLEVGSSTGELLLAAQKHFAVLGIEADRASSDVARSRGVDCLTGSIPELQVDRGPFDVIALYHTIEHVPSPRKVLTEANRLLKHDGCLVLETPNIDNVWFRLLGARWRQFIPDHRYFFSKETIIRLLRESGFEVKDMRSVGKAMSTRLFASRLGRYHRGLGQVVTRASYRFGIEDKTLRLNFGDVMRVYARK